MDYYSLKMRASQQIGEGDQKREQHISGAERIVSREAVEAVCSAMARRALTHSKGDPDFINIKIEKVCEKDIQILKALPVTRVDVDSWQQGLDKAFELIDKAVFSCHPR
jgi:6-carboxyhexanoate--CoA ligase